MAFRKFGTFRTPHGWLTTTGDGEVLQRGKKRESLEDTSGSALQFEVTVVDNDKIKIKVGYVIAAIGGFTDNLGPQICNYLFKVGKVFATPFASVIGTEPDSDYMNEGGYVSLPSSPVENTATGTVYVWVARNMKCIGPHGRLNTQQGYPWLIVTGPADTLDVATRPWGNEDACDMIDWYMCEDLFHFNPDPLGGAQVYGRYQNVADCKPKTYNCQRFMVAKVQYESGVWKVYQNFQGTVTLPNPYVFRGNVTNVSEYWDYPPYPNLGQLPTWRLAPEHLTEQNAWESAMASNDKGHAYPTVIYKP